MAFDIITLGTCGLKDSFLLHHACCSAVKSVLLPFGVLLTRCGSLFRIFTWSISDCHRPRVSIPHLFSQLVSFALTGAPGAAHTPFWWAGVPASLLGWRTHALPGVPVRSVHAQMDGCMMRSVFLFPCLSYHLPENRDRGFLTF